MRIAVDSSALAKRYVVEAGSNDVITACSQATDILVSVLVTPEVLSAFNRLQREKRITVQRYRALKRRLIGDLAQATLIGVTPSVIGKAVQCLERHPLRAADAVHVATALVSSADLFITFDKRQREVARAMGLSVGPPSL